MKNLVVRSLTGFAFVAIILGCLLISKYLYASLFLLILIGGLNEFYRFLNHSTVKPNKTAGFIISIYLFVTSFLINLGYLSAKYLIALFPLLLVAFIYELYRKKEAPIENIATTLLGILYIALPLSLTNFIVFPHSINNGEYSPLLMIALLSIIWIYDTGAYLFGVSFGKSRLFERISPKKSWEGAAGGMLLALILGWFMAELIPLISQINWLIISFITVISSTFGDLFESLIKRSIHVKDSGNLLPGHGGVLDRLDSLLFAIPVFFAFLKIFIE